MKILFRAPLLGNLAVMVESTMTARQGDVGSVVAQPSHYLFRAIDDRRDHFPRDEMLVAPDGA